ncbi:MAG: TIGR03862 family flavoprotein [Candidatus Aquirickettsiella gammari]
MDIRINQIVAVIGAGPAGLMAAAQIAKAGYQVHVYDAMPSAGRKFLLAGKSGMNLTHSEEFDIFKKRYRERSEDLQAYLEQFDADAIRSWAKELGIETFVGSSGRVFPVDMKAAPLLRAWLHRLRQLGVQFHMRHKWIACEGQQLIFKTPEGARNTQADAVVFALGGASWKRLGSDGLWTSIFEQQGITINPFQASNCGFMRPWSSHFSQRFAGVPLTNVQISVPISKGEIISRQGQFVITERGVEGSLIYSISAELREQICINGYAEFMLDLLPGKSNVRVFDELNSPRGSRSLSSHLRSKLGLHPIHCALLYEILTDAVMKDNVALAAKIKALPIRLNSSCPIDEAISSAGGVKFSDLDKNLMLKIHPGWFCSGEMLDWEAPTGGYLLSACFATGVAAGRGVNNWLEHYGQAIT